LKHTRNLFFSSGILLALFGCQGGGEGGDETSSDFGFQLIDARYGRLVEEGGEQRVVSPLSTVRTDPISGRTLPGSVEPLSPSVRLDALVTLGLGHGYVPRVIPRNAVLVLEFSEAVDPKSIVVDQLDDQGQVLGAGNIRMRRQSTSVATGVSLDLSVQGREIWLNPVLTGQVGLPPSPLNFSADGEARASSVGFLQLSLDHGPGSIRSLGGRPLVSREDRLGRPNHPIGLNPGNQVLDFIARDELIPINETFRGFLPDLTPPRIVRRHEVQGSLEFAAGDHADPLQITDLAQSFSDLANQGLGEWAGHPLTLRPGGADEETRLVVRNSASRLEVDHAFTQRPEDGDLYLLRRPEFFEPDPLDPIDPQLFDPSNPEGSRNRHLAHFIEAYEIDANLQPVRALDLRRDALPPNLELRITFNEPMSLSSFGAWETFMVRPSPMQPGHEKVARVTLDPSQTVATIQPVRMDAQGQARLVGWGPGVQLLELTLGTLPNAELLLEKLLSKEAVREYLEAGRRALTDLGGQPLAFPRGKFQGPESVLEFSERFFTDDSAITANLQAATDFGDWGILVHRFQGQPVAGLDPLSGKSGVLFRDQIRTYTRIPDVNLLANGFLAPPPVTYVRKVHDDFFPPLDDGNFLGFSSGLLTPLLSAKPQWGGSGYTYDGIRFQLIYRDEDCSPGANLAGTLLDLYQVSWSPIGGNVTTDIYDDISIHAAHSSQRPRTNVNSITGLHRPFGYDIWLNSHMDFWGHGATGPYCDFPQSSKRVDGSTPGPNHYDELITCVQPGTTYRIHQNDIFTVLGSGNSWLPWPAFQTPFPYNNGHVPTGFHERREEINQMLTGGDSWPWSDVRDGGNRGGDSLLLEVRIRPQSALVSLQNGFTFSYGNRRTHIPMFRAWSAGDPTHRLFPDQINCDVRARCADGPHTVTGNRKTFGDNSRYFKLFDFVKTTALITSSYLPVIGTLNPAFDTPILDPPLALQPLGTTTEVHYSGSHRRNGSQPTTFGSAPSDHNGHRYLAFRVRFFGNQHSLLTPTLDTLAIPYRR
jgi:hypothetical protein